MVRVREDEGCEDRKEDMSDGEDDVDMIRNCYNKCRQIHLRCKSYATCRLVTLHTP